VVRGGRGWGALSPRDDGLWPQELAESWSHGRILLLVFCFRERLRQRLKQLRSAEQFGERRHNQPIRRTLVN
jgi:hypothetical protein